MRPGRSRLELVIVALEVVLILGALLGAFGLLSAPDGSNMGWTKELLDGTPFSDFLLPGLILLIANAVFPAIVAIASLRGAPWAKMGHLAVGCILAGWIAAQVLLIGYLTALQPLFGGLGIAIAALALLLWRGGALGADTAA